MTEFFDGKMCFLYFLDNKNLKSAYNLIRYFRNTTPEISKNI